MKKVLLLGDSIRMGYDEYVRDLLKDKCEVYYDDKDNGRFAAYTLWQANQLFRKHGKFDVVHWNNGYWDMNIEAPMTEAIHPIVEYIHFFKRIIGEIRNNGAAIIFATTTPVLSSGYSLDNTGTAVHIQFNNDWVVHYNETAKRVAAEESITVNDLYELMLQDKSYYKCEDGLHLTEEGYRLCAEQAAKLILEKL
ncbi:hypothetical protein B1748_15500 [Paenibacillus sp. MY03]|uniref:SGNH/GDSL hydrolase family protein n=1 Tax=Paenibacillus sp. MY03 TaxID=302980 RepID=UPI000B3CCBCE|nr:SGNH/GDSL hydrolase family protein [Paenibacillus sp. MY03]OUS75832.1 hypothetical protein B1748_15500 [Paenibacillus sp. MY03]